MNLVPKVTICDYPGQKKLASGQMKIFDLPMSTMPDKRLRTIRVWLPDSYDGVQRFPVLYLHDGQNLFDGLDERWKWYIDREMKKVPDEAQPIVVAIDTLPARRFEELCPPWPLTPFIKDKPYARGLVPMGDRYMEFVTDILKPIIDSSFLTKPEREFTGIGGSSFGGIQSLYMFLARPDVFGRAMCFSTAFGMSDMAYILDRIRDGYKGIKDGRLYFFNGGQTVDGTNILPTLEAYETLKALGMDYRHLCFINDTRQQHFESGWQKNFADAVEWLYAADNSVVLPPPMPPIPWPDVKE